MIPGKKYTPDDVLAILWRRKWLIVIPTVLIAAGTIAYTRTLPNTYRSETLVMIQPPPVLPELTKAAALPSFTYTWKRTVLQAYFWTSCSLFLRSLATNLS